MLTIIFSMLIGAGAGIAVSVALMGAGFLAEVFNVGYAILTCDCDREVLFNWDKFGSLILICLIGGAVIGLIFGIFVERANKKNEADKKRDAVSEQAREQRREWANEIRRFAVNVHQTCSEQTKEAENPVAADYQAEKKMEEMASELMNAAELQGKVRALEKELAEKGGSAL